MLTLVILLCLIVAVVVICNKVREHSSRISSLEQIAKPAAAKAKR